VEGEREREKRAHEKKAKERKGEEGGEGKEGLCPSSQNPLNYALLILHYLLGGSCVSDHLSAVFTHTLVKTLSIY